MKSREHYEVSAAARQVASQVRSARMNAIVRNRDCRFRVNSPVSYVIECMKESIWIPTAHGAVPPALTITANAAPRFHRRGNASPSATISVWNSSGRVRRIIVNINGRVRIE